MNYSLITASLVVTSADPHICLLPVAIGKPDNDKNDLKFNWRFVHLNSFYLPITIRSANDETSC